MNGSVKPMSGNDDEEINAMWEDLYLSEFFVSEVIQVEVAGEVDGKWHA